MSNDRSTLTEVTLTRPFKVSDVLKRKKQFTLEQVDGPGSPTEHVLNADEVVVGRSRDAGLCFASTMMSRKHAVFRKSGPEYTVTDLDSKYGLYLNGVKAHSAVLREGDVVQLGDVTFVYHEGG